MEDINVKSVRYPISVDQKFEKIALKLGRTKRQLLIEMVDYFYKSKKDPTDLKILKDRVLTDKVLMGEDYQVVTSWVSPFNAKKAMVIYTAQKTENIKNYDYSPVKDQYHYWVAKNTITIDKGDYGKYWQMWMFNF